MNTRKKIRNRPSPSPKPKATDYLLRESDLERIEGMIEALSLAVTAIVSCRQIREGPGDEVPEVEDFDSQVALVLDEADRRMRFPWAYPSDF